MKAVVLGHTHGAEMDKDRRLFSDRGYVNAGFWCHEHPTFVEVDKHPQGFTMSLLKVSPKPGGDIEITPEGDPLVI